MKAILKIRVHPTDSVCLILSQIPFIFIRQMTASEKGFFQLDRLSFVLVVYL